MPKAAPIQTNFTAGELSPRLEGRVDISKYFNGVHKLQNMVIHTHGGVTRRGGTKFISNAKDIGDKKIRLIPFQFSVEQAYILEFGEGYIHFYKDEEKIGAGDFSGDFSGDFAGATTVFELTTTYLESELFEIQYVQSADVLYIAHPSHEPAKLSRLTEITFKIEDEKFINGPYLDENTTLNTITPTAVTGSVTLSATASIFSATDIGRIVRIDEGSDFGYAEITGYTNGTTVSALVIDDFVTASAQTKWRLGSFSETTGYPSCVAFYEDRLWYAATITSPQTLWGSMSGIYEDFSPGANDDDGVQYTIASDQVNAVRWLSPGKSLVVGTVGGEFLVSATTRGEAITPSNIKIVRQSEYGSAYIYPVRSNGVVLFVQGSAKKIRQFVYQFESDSYIAPDLTLLSEHITGNGITELAYQREPDSIVWSVRNDGVLLGMTYERDQEVTGWHRHQVGGVSGSNGALAKIESVAVIPKSGADQVWISVKRFVDNKVSRCVEVIEIGRDNIIAEDSDDFFVDSGVRYSGIPATVISGGDHLEGETVQVLADGAVMANKVVIGGAITLDKPASKVNYGLAYVSEIETMRLEAGSANGTSQSKIKRINKVAFRFFETLGAKFGPDNNSLDILPFRSTSDPMNQSPPRFTGDKEVSWNNGYETDGRLLIRQDQPLPMTVLAIMPRVRTND